MSKSLVQIAGLVLGAIAILVGAILFSVVSPRTPYGGAFPGFGKDMGLVFLGMGAGANIAMAIVYPRLVRGRKA